MTANHQSRRFATGKADARSGQAANAPLADIGAGAHHGRMNALWVSIIVAAPLTGFLVGHLKRVSMRWWSFVALLLAPALVMTIVLALTPPAPPSFLAWWGAAMIMISPAIVVWAVLVTIGFAASRRTVR